MGLQNDTAPNAHTLEAEQHDAGASVGEEAKAVKGATRAFHLGDILSITTGKLVSPRHINGVYDILNYMTGDDLFTHQLGRASEECKPCLLVQFPQLDTPEMQLAADGELPELIDAAKRTGEDVGLVVSGWLAKQVALYGEMHAVGPLPQDGPWQHTHIDPLSELEEMVGKDRVIMVGEEAQAVKGGGA